MEQTPAASLAVQSTANGPYEILPQEMKDDRTRTSTPRSPVTGQAMLASAASTTARSRCRKGLTVAVSLGAAALVTCGSLMWLGMGHHGSTSAQRQAAAWPQEAQGASSAFGKSKADGSGEALLAAPRATLLLANNQTSDKDLLYTPDDYEEQEDASKKAGDDIKVYALGSSNVVWMTWMDELHLYLKRLGFKVPLLDTKIETDPRRPQKCDDTPYFESLKTSHLGKVGWSSWDFVFDDWDDCNDEGFRNISGIMVKCGHGPGCDEGREPNIKLSDIAADAALSDVTLVATWFNDHKQPTTNPPYKCFKGEKIHKENTSRIAIPNLLKLVRAIHEKNEKTWVLVLREYPMTSNYQVTEDTVPWINILNDRVGKALSGEPNTLFVDYPVPSKLEMYQKANYGHPNCRGSRLMAQGILDSLYEAKVISRTVKLEDRDKNLENGDCDSLEAGAACEASALCWTDKGKCLPFGPGSDKWYKPTE